MALQIKTLRVLIHHSFTEIAVTGMQCVSVLNLLTVTDLHTTLSLKVHENALKCSFFDDKISKFSGEGHIPSDSTPHTRVEGEPLQTPPHSTPSAYQGRCHCLLVTLQLVVAGDAAVLRPTFLQNVC